MSRPSNDERLAKIHAEALEQFDKIQSAMKDERLQCLQDRRFYSIPGAQWEGALAEQFENKPQFEVNKVHLAVLRIINEYRNNRITVDFTSKDGTENDLLADTCDGLYRADEQDSGAEEAYDNAFEEAVGGGFGAFRLRACYEDEEDPENEFQRIRIEPIYDADACVFFDLDAKRQDKADAKHCFVLTSQSPDSYKDEWDDDPITWPKSIEQGSFDWSTPDVVFVAEYYRIEEVRDESVVFVDLQGNEERYRQSELDENEEMLAELKATGRKEIRRKKIKVKRVHKCIMSGGKVLEDCGIIAGKLIPIVPVYGKRWFVDSIERCMGHVRLAKDAQRLKNMQLSKLGELSAYSSVSKPIFTPEQMAGHGVMWADDNLKNYPYLLVNPITDASGQQLPSGPVAYTKAPEIPQAMAALLQITEQDMQEILGNPQNAEKMVSNVSGKTVELIQQRLDMQTYIYMSNMSKARRRGGEIWLSMAKELYADKGRKMKTLGLRGEASSIELMQSIENPETQEVLSSNDLTQASFDVAVEVGPSSTSRRDATVRALTNMLSLVQDPETAQVIQSMILLNMEGEGISDVRDYFRLRMVKMGVLEPNDKEKKILEAAKAGQQKDPNTTYLEAAAQEATAKAVKARVETIETLADTELTRAKTMETLAGIGQQKPLANAAQTLQQVGAQNSIGGQDTNLVHVNEQEEAALEQMGGSGRIDPVTGLRHFDAGGNRSDTSGHNSANGPSGDGGGQDHGGGGTGRTSATGTSNPENSRNYSESMRDGGGNQSGYTQAQREARMQTAYGTVDPTKVEEGTAYGIDRGSFSWNDAYKGFKLGSKAGMVVPGAKLIGGLAGGVIGGLAGRSPAVNGGGWGSGGSGTGFGAGNNEISNMVSRESNGGSNNGSMSSAPSQGITQTAKAPAQTAATPAENVYQPYIPVDQWVSLDPAAREQAMLDFWKSF